LLSREGGYFAPANLELSVVYLTSKRYDEAISNLQMVAMRDGSHYPISYYHLGRLYEGRGDLKQAESCFTQTAAAFGKKNVQFLLDVSRVREKQGNFKGALEAMESYLSIIGEQGQQPAWSNERLTALRAKVEKN
jgi:tetratricopeptide (TPR) repeat protein